MKREILRIDEELCNGCGQCVPNCHEGALQVIDGKVRLVSELMCDGLGACIGHCPEGAITIETREAEPYDEISVLEQMKSKEKNTIITHLKHLKDQPLIHNHQQHNGGGCPGASVMVIERAETINNNHLQNQASELRQWPVQMHLINPGASYFAGSDLLLAADCVAFSMGEFHSKHLKGKSLAIACPKLDQGTEIYVQKLVSLVDNARINTISIIMMEVPCCGGLLQMVKAALANSSRKVPVKKTIIAINGDVLVEEWI